MCWFPFLAALLLPVIVAGNDGTAWTVPGERAQLTEPEVSEYPDLAPEELLPSRLGPLEKVLWGRSGLMRSLGFPLEIRSRERELALRRFMMNAHQTGGYFTLASMTAMTVTGQMILNGRGDLGGAKRLLVSTTVIGYFTTATLALFTPPPIIRREGWNSVSWHKALAVVHFTGMIVTPLLGKVMDGDEDLRMYHQAAGYVTLAALAAGMVVVAF